MAYKLQPATLDDVPAFATIFDLAFRDDHVMGFFHPHTPPDVLFDHNKNLFKRLLSEDPSFGRRFTKAVQSSTGSTVGFAAWVYPHHLTPEQIAEKEAKAAELRKERNPQGSQDALVNEFLDKLKKGREKWINPEKTFCKLLFLPALRVYFSISRKVGIMY